MAASKPVTKYTAEIGLLRDWVVLECVRRGRVIELGYYLDGDDGQPNPTDVYCRTHASSMAQRLSRRTGKHYTFLEAWAGSDTVERCAISTCDVTLDCGGLTKEGVRWALGCDEESPLAFVASPDELDLAARAMSNDDPLWDIWVSQVLRLQNRVSKAQQLAFEAAWVIDNRELALDILRRALQPKRRRRRAA